MPSPRLNVIYFVTHDQGIATGEYSKAGADALTDAFPGLVTPHHDRLSHEGVTFRHHFGTAPMCSPARGSLMTGQYPHQNGLTGLTHRGFAYHPDITTVVNEFHNAGYHTLLAGLQHEAPRNVSAAEKMNRLGYATHFAPEGTPLSVMARVLKKRFHTLADQAAAGKPF